MKIAERLEMAGVQVHDEKVLAMGDKLSRSSETSDHLPIPFNPSIIEADWAQQLINHLVLHVTAL